MMKRSQGHLLEVLLVAALLAPGCSDETTTAADSAVKKEAGVKGDVGTKLDRKVAPEPAPDQMLVGERPLSAEPHDPARGARGRVHQAEGMEAHVHVAGEPGPELEAQEQRARDYDEQGQKETQIGLFSTEPMTMSRAARHKQRHTGKHPEGGHPA